MKTLRNRKLERFAVVLALAATTVIAFAAGTQGRPKDDASTAARIQRLEDIEEIRTLLIEYGRLLDAHDLAGYSHLFARGGECIGGFGSAKGPAAIQALMEKNLGVTRTSRPGSTYHLLTNFEIDVHGDKATAWSRWSFTVTAENKPAILYGGHYDDTLVREDGRWRFQRRVAAADIPHSDPTEVR